MRIDLEYDTAQFDAEVSAYIDTAIRPAIASGLTAAAVKVQQDLQAELITDIDDPTPFTKQAIGMYGPKPSKTGELDALVFLRPIQAQYLGYQIDGGIRRAGDYATLETGVLVPGPDAKLDRYGNLPRGFVTEALAGGDAWWMKPKKGNYTALVRRVPGERMQLLAFIMPQVEYEPRFDFYDTAERSANQHIGVEISAALAIATAKSDSLDQ